MHSKQKMFSSHVKQRKTEANPLICFYFISEISKSRKSKSAENLINHMNRQIRN